MTDKDDEIKLYQKFFRPIENQVSTQLAIHVEDFDWDDFYESVYSIEPERWTVYVSGFADGYEHSTESIFRRMLEVSNPIKLRFFGFSSMLTYFRRRKAFSLMRELFDSYNTQFQSLDMAEFAKGVVFKHSDNVSEVAIAVETLQRFLEKHAERPDAGFMQAYADAVVIAVDRELNKPPFDSDKHLQNAEKEIAKAIQLNSSYPKYYATLAQIQFHLKDFSQAMSNAKKAMQLEDPASPEHSLRLLDYQSIYMKAEIYKDISKFTSTSEEVKSEIQEMKDKLSEEKGRSVEFIGVFSALIALVMATSSIITGGVFVDSVFILMILGGILLIIVESMMVRLVSKRDKWEPMLFVAAGIALIIIAIVTRFAFVLFSIL